MTDGQRGWQIRLRARFSISLRQHEMNMTAGTVCFTTTGFGAQNCHLVFITGAGSFCLSALFYLLTNYL